MAVEMTRANARFIKNHKARANHEKVLFELISKRKFCFHEKQISTFSNWKLLKIASRLSCMKEQKAFRAYMKNGFYISVETWRKSNFKLI